MKMKIKIFRCNHIIMYSKCKFLLVLIQVDIYSLGVVFLEIFHPFETESERLDTLMKLKENKYLTTWVGDILLLKMLTALNPIERASISDVLVILNLYLFSA